MATLLDLAARLDRTRESLAVRGNAAKVKVATVIIEGLIADTPVDTSKALSNWLIGIGKPVTAPVEPYFFGTRGSTQEISGAAALAKARTLLAAVKPGQPVTISNLLPYIRLLNDGSSTQHPGGFVEINIQRGRNALKRR